MKRELESPKVMGLSLDRHLKNKDYSLSILWKRKKLGGKNSESLLSLTYSLILTFLGLKTL